MDSLIDRFIEKISTEKKFENTVNPYSDKWEHSEYARHNLKIYLQNISNNNSRILF